MGFIDKAKEAISNAAEKIKDPDGSIVEDTWPAGDGPVPADTSYEEEAQNVEGIDPDLDTSVLDQYDEGEEEGQDDEFEEDNR